MNDPIHGFIRVPADVNIVGFLLIRDRDRYTEIVNPDETELALLCEEYDLPFDKLMGEFKKLSPDIHTVILDAEKFRQEN